MIKVESVTKKIKQKTVLENINLEIQKGKGYLLRGHNGSGKTMILRLLCGLIKPTTGNINFDGNLSFGVIIENPSFIEGESALYNLKYLANINKKISVKDINDSLKLVNLYESRNEKVAKYSLGMKQRLAICQAIMEKPDILLLDEPFNALDDESYKNTVSLLKKLKDSGKTIVIATHGKELMNDSLFDKIFEMNNGKLIPLETTNELVLNSSV